MVSQKRDARFFRIRMQGGFREPILLSQGRESRPSFLFLCTRNGARCLPRRVCAHLAQPPLPFGEHRIVELPPYFQVRTHSFGLACLHLQGQFKQKRWRFRFGVLALPGLLCAHLPHALSCARTSIPSIAGFPASVKRLIAARCALLSPPHIRNGASSPA